MYLLLQQQTLQQDQNLPPERAQQLPQTQPEVLITLMFMPTVLLRQTLLEALHLKHQP